MWFHWTFDLYCQKNNAGIQYILFPSLTILFEELYSILDRQKDQSMPENLHFLLTENKCPQNKFVN